MSKDKLEKKLSLRKLSKMEPTIEETNAQANFVHHGPALSTAILMAAKLDHELEALILEKIVNKSADVTDVLTGANGPISTFSQKIDLAYAFGFCDKITAENMHIIRKVRNLFAHASKVFEFDNPHIAAEIYKLKFPQGYKAGEHLRGALRDKKPELAREVYISFCYILSNAVLKKHNSFLKRKTSQLVARAKKLNLGLSLLQESSNSSD